MCNPKNYSDSPATSRSTVEELHRPIPSLFRALTEGESPINMMVVSFPIAEELSHHENLVSFLESLDNPHQNVSVPGNSIHTSYDAQGTAASDLVTLIGFLYSPHEAEQRKPVLPPGNHQTHFKLSSASKTQTKTLYYCACVFSPSVSSCRVFHLYLWTLAATCGHKIRTKVNSSPEWVGFSCIFPFSQKELVLPVAADLETFSFAINVQSCRVIPRSWALG